MEYRFRANDESDTDRLGAALARCLPPQTTVALLGTLGAGKTRLVQGLAAACGIDPEHVVSPTFVLCQQYVGDRTIHHLDAYRIQDDDEFLELGVDELFDSPGVTIVEWADRVADCLPPAHVRISIELSGQDARTFVISQVGAADSEWLARLAEMLSG